MSLPESDVHAVILAGGSGTRFWPRSRHLRPKQLCKIGPGQATMLEETLARLEGFIAPERRIIVTHTDQADATRAIGGASVAKVVAEPDARNTAAALALAAIELERDGKPKIMVSLHADAVIRDVPAFKAALAEAIHVARAGYLTLVGIVPEYAETGYGYIERGESFADASGAFKVASFREKPDRETAERFVASGRFLWNAGIFVWRTDVLLAELEARLPQTVDAIRSHVDDPAALARVYRELPKISIDNAVLEVSDKVAVVPGDIGWQDVGSWDALARAFGSDAEGNFLKGDVLALDCKDVTIDSDGPFVAALGLRDLVVVASQGAILVCPKDRAQDVKTIVERLREQRRTDLI